MEETFSNDDRYQVSKSELYLDTAYKYVLVDSETDGHLAVSNDKE